MQNNIHEVKTTLLKAQIDNAAVGARVIRPLEFRSWHSRGYLPHFDLDQIPQSITFRLTDSLPLNLLHEWAAELDELPKVEANTERCHRIEEYLDKGLGKAWLSIPTVAEVVEQALCWSDGYKYSLHAWVIMPNHVHALITPMPDMSLARIMHSWKTWTARKANVLLNRKGTFWQEEYFDRYIRNEQHFDATIAYIEHNPVKSGLCQRPEDWRYSSAYRKR
jgi:putative DNA methylase